jgi:hypothetical protein
MGTAVAMRSMRQIRNDDLRFFFALGSAGIVTLVVFVFASTLQGRQSQHPILYPAVYQAEDSRVQWSGDRRYPSPYFGLLEMEGAQFGQAISSAGAVTFRAYGTDVWIREIGDYQVLMDGEFRPFTGGSERTWQQISLFSSPFPETHEFVISCITLCPVRIDTITIIDRTLNYFSLIFGILALAVWFLIFVMQLLWERRQR